MPDPALPAPRAAAHAAVKIAAAQPNSPCLCQLPGKLGACDERACACSGAESRRAWAPVICAARHGADKVAALRSGSGMAAGPVRWANSVELGKASRAACRGARRHEPRAARRAIRRARHGCIAEAAELAQREQ